VPYGPIPSQFNLFHTYTPYFCHFSVSFPSGLVPLGFLNEAFMNCVLHVPAMFIDSIAIMIFDVELNS
jgi:hypothetical protein